MRRARGTTLPPGTPPRGPVLPSGSAQSRRPASGPRVSASRNGSMVATGCHACLEAHGPRPSRCELAGEFGSKLWARPCLEEPPLRRNHQDAVVVAGQAAKSRSMSARSALPIGQARCACRRRAPPNADPPTGPASRYRRDGSGRGLPSPTGRSVALPVPPTASSGPRRHRHRPEDGPSFHGRGSRFCDTRPMTTSWRRPPSGRRWWWRTG